ncbi:MAG: hypothetical protein IIV20_04430, partial [Bacteroidaceae bacterium]|nr:hypothetical protein [Bacteroidaceae bacterium]
FFLVWLSPKGFSPSAQAAMPERASKRVTKRKRGFVLSFLFSVALTQGFFAFGSSGNAGASLQAGYQKKERLCPLFSF